MDDTGIWVSNYTAGTVSHIDAQTNTVVATVEDVGSGVGIAACDGSIMASTRGLGVSRIDPKTHSLTSLAELSEWNYGIACGEDELWISSVSPGVVHRIPLPGLH